jgi:hypothetical protein
MATLLESALHYLERYNFSLIPFKNDKSAPYIKEWLPYKEKHPTRDEIIEWWTAWPKAMIALVCGKISNLCLIDFDTYKQKDKNLLKIMMELIPNDIPGPMAHTPRGGFHRYFMMPDDIVIQNGKSDRLCIDIKGEGGLAFVPPSFNGNGKGYVWEPGRGFKDTALHPLDIGLYNNIIKSFNTYIGGVENETNIRHFSTKFDNFLQEGNRDNDLFHVANCLIKGNCEKELASKIIEILARNCDPPFPEREIESKISSAIQRSDRKSRNITAEVREWVDSTNGDFFSTNVENFLHLSTLEDKKLLSKILSRLKDDGIIEKGISRKNGSWRKIDRTLIFMDFASADIENYVNISLPLGIEKKTKLYPKAVIVIAGVTGMGKTLFCLNTIARNFRILGKEIYYFNSEMGPESLKKKLNYFPGRIDDWEKFMKVTDEWDFNNIQDKVVPDALNVIDYLEPEGEKPYNIHGVISSIIQRLNKGIALISVQKKPDARMGTGGIYSLKAASLGLALDFGQIEIVKNRCREEDPEPLLQKIKFEIHRGHYFKQVGEWEK